MLVFLLEAFEELGLDVLQARVSCSDNFHLEAMGAKVRKKMDECPFDSILTRAPSLSTHKTHTHSKDIHISTCLYMYAHLMMYQVNEGADEVDAQMVKEAVLEAIKNWSEISKK